MPRLTFVQRLSHVAVSSFLSVLIAYGQAAPQPRFEAASVKLSEDQAVMQTKPELSAGRIVWTTQLQYLASYAYDVDLSRVSFAGRGLGTIYVVNAVFPPSIGDADLRMMLQSLLADRFNMRAHRDIKEVDGFALAVARGGIKLKESTETRHSDPDSRAPLPPAGDGYVTAIGAGHGVMRIKGQAGSIKQLTQILGRVTGMPLVDQTGLHGRYDFEFRYSDVNADAETDAPPLSTAVRESLGLSILKQKVSFETLVVDELGSLSAD